MYTAKINLTMKEKRVPKDRRVITEEFDEFLGALDFSHTMVQSVLTNTKYNYDLDTMIYSEDDEKVSFEHRSIVSNGKITTNCSLHLNSDTEAKDFMNEEYLLAAIVSPPKNLSIKHCKFEPACIYLPKLNKRKSAKFFKAGYYVYKSDSHIPSKTEANFVKRDKFVNGNYCLIELDNCTYNDICSLIAANIPLLSESLAYPYNVFESIVDETGRLHMMAGGIKKEDWEEYCRQYKEACKTVIKGFDEGMFKATDGNTLNWISWMKELIEKEKLEEQE